MLFGQNKLLCDFRPKSLLTKIMQLPKFQNITFIGHVAINFFFDHFNKMSTASFTWKESSPKVSYSFKIFL